MVPISICSPLSLLGLALGFMNNIGGPAPVKAPASNPVSASVSLCAHTAPTLSPCVVSPAPRTAVLDFNQSIVAPAQATPAVFILPNAQPALPPIDSGSDQTANPDTLAAQESELIGLINRERLAQGLAALTPDPLLSSIARSHSEDMCVRNYFDHRAPAPAPQTPMDRYLAALPQRPDYAMVGENIYYRSCADSIAEYAGDAHQAFMNSPGHRANILMPQYTQVGVGIYRNPSTGEFWVTEMFLSSKQ